MLRFLLILIVASALLGCGTSDPKKLALKAEPLVNFEPTVTLKKVWSSTAGSGQDVRYSRLTAVLDGDGALYTVGVDGDVQALDAKKGKVLWTTRTQTEISGGTGVSSNAVLFGTYDGYVHALNKSSGEKLWSTKVSSEVVSAPVGNSDLVVANTIDGRVFALDAATGEQRWSYDHPTPVLTLRGTASPLLTPSQVIVAFDSGQIVSLSASDGSSQWQFRVSRPQGRTELDRIVDIDGTPILSGGYIYAGSFQGNVVAASRGNGRVMWSSEESTAYPLAVADGKVYVSTEESRIVALNAITGKLEWENFQLKRRNTGAPTIVGDYLAVADTRGFVHILSAEDGTMAYRFRALANTGGIVTDKYSRVRAGYDTPAVRSPMAAADGILYVFADSGRLTAYTIKPIASEK